MNNTHPTLIISKTNEEYKLLKWNEKEYIKISSNTDLMSFLQSPEFNKVMADKKKEEDIDYNNLSPQDMDKISQIMRWYTRKTGRYL